MAKASGAFRNLASRVRRVEEKVGHALYESVQFGADQMQQYILERGTNNTWKHEWPRASGGMANYSTVDPSERTDSGHMLASVESSNITYKNGVMQAKAGWVREQEPYFLAQEKGFRANKTIGNGRYEVDGMFALRDAKEDTVEHMQGLMSKIVKEGFK